MSNKEPQQGHHAHPALLPRTMNKRLLLLNSLFALQ